MKTRIHQIMHTTGLSLIGLACLTLIQLNDAHGQSSEDQTTKTEAYIILKNKCNVCHKSKNPFKVFNLNNMNRHVYKIENQVFELERMPKGNNISLTQKEKETLKTWIESIKQ